MGARLLAVFLLWVATCNWCCLDTAGIGNNEPNPDFCWERHLFVGARVYPHAPRQTNAKGRGRGGRRLGRSF